MDVLKMRFTPPFTLRSRRSRNDPGSSAAAENLLRRCPKRAGSLKSARGSAHGDAQRVCYITALWPKTRCEACSPCNAPCDPLDGFR